MSAPLSTGGFLPASPRVLGVVGVGLIGTSVALAARRRWPGLQIIGIDRPNVLLHPLVAAALDLASPDFATLASADVVVVATPVDTVREIMPTLASVAAGARAIVDTGSTKRTILAAARNAGLRNFVGGHPMAGAARSGAELARDDFFDHRIWFLVDEGDTEVGLAAQAFVEGLGARVERVDAETHDRVLAAISHLPQAVASVLMSVAAEAAGSDALRWAGAGLRDTTRLASSAPEVWTSILTSNAGYVAPLLLEMSNALRHLAEHLDEPEAIDRVFRAATAARVKLDAVAPHAD